MTKLAVQDVINRFCAERDQRLGLSEGTSRHHETAYTWFNQWQYLRGWGPTSYFLSIFEPEIYDFFTYFHRIAYADHVLQYEQKIAELETQQLPLDQYMQRWWELDTFFLNEGDPYAFRKPTVRKLKADLGMSHRWFPQIMGYLEDQRYPGPFGKMFDCTDGIVTIHKVDIPDLYDWHQVMWQGLEEGLTREDIKLHHRIRRHPETKQFYLWRG